MTPTPEQFQNTPVNRHLGFRFVRGGEEDCVVEMEPRPELIQEAGVVHGGVLAALADTASVYILFPHLAPGNTLTSIEFKMNFLKPVREGAGTVRAHARVVQRGRKVAVTDVDVFQADRLSAKGVYTYLFLSGSGEDPSPGR